VIFYKNNEIMFFLLFCLKIFLLLLNAIKFFSIK